MTQISSHQKMTQDDYEVISIMIQYLKNELSDTCSSKVEKLIFGCKECQRLFEDVRFFFDEEEVLVFELLNEEKINRTRANFNAYVVQKDDVIEASFSQDNFNSDNLGGWWNRPCFCCED